MFSGWIVRWNEARAYQHASMPAHIASTRRGPFERTYVSRARQRSLRSVVDFKLVRGRQSRSGMRWRSAGSRGAPRPPSRLYPTSARPSFRGSNGRARLCETLPVFRSQPDKNRFTLRTIGGQTITARESTLIACVWSMLCASIAYRNGMIEYCFGYEGNHWQRCEWEQHVCCLEYCGGKGAEQQAVWRDCINEYLVFDALTCCCFLFRILKFVSGFIQLSCEKNAF